MVRRDILVADDEEANRAVMQELFERHGYRVVQASNGIEAIELIFSRPFSLGIFDVKMPKLGGIDALRRLRQERIEMPVLITTSIRTEEIKNEAMESGAAGFFYKPIELDPLRIFVKSLIGEETSLTLSFTRAITIKIES